MSEEHPVLSVRAWWWLEDHLPGLLPAERWFFHWKWAVKNPRLKYYDMKKWHDRPKIGELVTDCRYEIHRVNGFLGNDEDLLVLDDGTSCSWTHCCHRPRVFAVPPKGLPKERKGNDSYRNTRR